MTTNQERAAEAIFREFGKFAPGFPVGAIADDLAQALADAGLITPDALPPLDFYDDCGVWPINAHPDQYVEMRVTGTGRRLVEMYAPRTDGTTDGAAPSRRTHRSSRPRHPGEEMTTMTLDDVRRIVREARSEDRVPDLSGMDLTGMDLSDANLHNVITDN